jgi:general secretion pathway protein E/type IV pilus assembly protein PilB
VITRQTGLQPDIRIVERTRLVNAVHNHYYFLEHPVESLIEKEVRVLRNDPDGVRPVDRLLEHIYHLAVKYRASDIHLRPMEGSVNVALRVDGVLRSMFSLPASLKRIISSVKMHANMDIAEQRLPQDGSFTETILNNDYYFRASTTVCPFGENMVLRVLPLQGAFMGMDQLGFLEEDVARVRAMFNEPFGIVLLTGPTGSGKTSTLYAALLTMDMLGKNIMTVENPIEYRFPLLRQTEVNTKAGYGFADAIRYFLRHDPDVMLVGEIRDRETAETAFSASETGHMVLSTLHTNSAFGAIPRLRALGIPSFVLADSLVGVVSQRLVRRICPACTEAYEAPPEELAYLGLEGPETLHRGRGCEVCGGSGYAGRTLIYEILNFERELAHLLRAEAEQTRLEAVAARAGFKTMFSVARAKVLQGVTSVAEVQRVLGHIAGAEA